MSSLQLLSARLQMSPLTPSDNHFILELVNTQGFIEFIGDRKVRSLSDADAYVQKIMSNANIAYWVVRLKESPHAIGIVTLIKRDYLDYHDVGFAFLPQFSKKGYALEAAIGVLENFLITYPHSTILATTFPANVKSIQLLKRLGLSYERNIKVEGEAEIQDRELHLYSVSKDQLLIQFATKAFYAVFSNVNGRTPNWNALIDICLPTALFTNKNNDGFVVAHLNDFMAPRKEKLSNGTLVEFEEYEWHGETKIIHNIAQRYSRYEKHGILNGVAFHQRGEKLIQFVKIENAWKVNAALWEDEQLK